MQADIAIPKRIFGNFIRDSTSPEHSRTPESMSRTRAWLTAFPCRRRRDAAVICHKTRSQLPVPAYCRMRTSTRVYRQISVGSKNRLTDGNLLASGCVIALTYPFSAILRVPLKAWRIFRQGQASLPRAIWQISRGAIAAPSLLRRNRDTLW